MKPIIMRELGLDMPKTVASLKEDSPLLAVIGTRDMVHYFTDHGFKEVRDFSKPLPPLGVTTKFRFKPVHEGRIVATDTIMVSNCKSRFSYNFRQSSTDRMVIGLGMSPEKMWDIFKNLGIADEAFGQRDDFRARFCDGHTGPNGLWIHKSMKNLAELSSIVRPYVQHFANTET